MKLVTLDFETYYDQDYSLSKMTTEAYIRDPRFEAIGYSMSVDGAEPTWHSGDDEHIRKSLGSQKWWDSVGLIAHNAAFDGAILAWRYGITPKLYIDTLSMARPKHGLTVGGSLKALAEHYQIGHKGTEVVDAKGKRRADFTSAELAAYGGYCKNDVALTTQLFHLLRKGFPLSELKVIDLMLRMYTQPVLELDKKVLVEHYKECAQKRQETLRNVAVSAGIGGQVMADAFGNDISVEEAIQKLLNSNVKFADLLRSFGCEPPMKTSLTTGKETYAFSKTDVAFKELLEHEDERVQAVVAARLGTKSTIEESRTEAFMRISRRGTLPILLNYYGGHTGRASGGDGVNPQNLTRGGALRRSIRAPEGMSLVVGDSAQIEARMNAWYSKQDDLVQAFAAGDDVYSMFASDVYGYKVDKSKKVERHVGKTCLSGETLVLSSKGWTPIKTVTPTDQLWDGEEWVWARGVVSNGWKQTLRLCGVWLTPDHLVLCGDEWKEAQYLEHDEKTLSLALARGVENLPLLGMSWASEVGCQHLLYNATVGFLSTWWNGITSKTSKLRGAIPAPSWPRVKNDTGYTPKLCQMTHTERDCLTGLQRQLLDATVLQTGHLYTTDAGASAYATSGEPIEQGSCSMFRPYRGGIYRSMRWIESTWTKATSQVISGLSAAVRIFETNGLLPRWRAKSKPLRKNCLVYDIVNCGPRNRFTILTESGPMIVHNCILGLGYGMGADKFKHTLKVGKPSVDMELPACRDVVNLYRAKYDRIKANWGVCEGMLHDIANGREREYGCIYTSEEGIHLPNGMLIRYPNLHQTDDGFVYTNRKKEVKIYGGKVAENLIQALARIVVFDQMLALADRGYKVAMTVHDEVVMVVPDEQVEEAKAAMEHIMSQAPAWATGLPIACEVDHGKCYGDAK